MLFLLDSEGKETAAMKWAQWMDDTFPLDQNVVYSTSLGEPGPKKVRVWQLSFRDDYGVSGWIEPDQFETLAELQLTTGWLVCRRLHFVY